MGQKTFLMGGRESDVISSMGYMKNGVFKIPN